MSIEEFIEEYRTKLDLDIEALSELVRITESLSNSTAGHPDSMYYVKETIRLKSKLDGVRLAKTQFNSLVKTL